MALKTFFVEFSKDLAKLCLNARHFSLHCLSEEHLQLQKTARNFAAKHLRPISAQLDKEHKFPLEQIKQLGDLGLMSIAVSPEYGGSGYNMLGTAVAVEEISKACGGTGSVVAIHNCLYAKLLDTFGTKNQKEKYLRPFTDGTIGCFALSEPDAGSDVVAMSATAKQDGDFYILNGTKSWVTSGPQSRAALVFATVNKNLKHKGITCFLVPVPTLGLSMGKVEDKLGIRASQVCNYYLENVKVPKENVIGNIGEGFVIAMKQLEKARVGIAAQALGIAQASLEVAIKYSCERKAYGKPIHQLQAVKLRLADMAARLEAARLLVWRAAVLTDTEERSSKSTSMAKLVASETATFVSHGAIQILGGMGYVTDYPVERHYRDARITEIYAGVNDVQKLLIADQIIKEYQ